MTSRKNRSLAGRQTEAEADVDEGDVRGAPVARTGGAEHRDSTTGFVSRTDFDRLDASEKSTEIHRQQRQAYSRDAAVISLLTGISRCVPGVGVARVRWSLLVWEAT
jgi:hypothetical protein